MGLNNKELVQKGKVLIAQGETPDFIPLLHNGRVEILSAPAEFEGLDSGLIISKSKRVGIIQGELILSGFNSSLSGPYRKSLRVIEDSDITKYPVNDGGIKQIIKQNPNFCLKLLNHLFSILENAISDASKYTKLYQNLNKINDNIALAHKAISSISTYEKLQNKSDNLYNIFSSNGGKAPSVFGAKFLISDNSQFLKKKYSFPGLPMESLIDYKQCQFIKKFLKLNANISESAGKEDPSMLADTYEILSDNFLKVLDRIESIHMEIDIFLAVLLGNDNSWASFLVDGRGFNSYLKTNRIAPDFIKDFLLLIKKLHAMYEEISGKSLIETYGGGKKIHRYYIGKPQGTGKTADVSETPAASTAAVGKAGQSIKKKIPIGPYKNSMQQIFEFALIDKEMQNKMLKTLNEFKNMSDPFNTEVEGRKTRKFVTKLYWDIYKQVYLRSQREEIQPPPVKLMIKFGFFDEDLLEGEQIQELHNLVSQKSNPGDIPDIPVMAEADFLKKIHIGKENPSITEMGQTYETFLKDEEKHGKSSEKEKYDSLDENTKKVMYEIDHRLTTTVAICSGSTSTAFPILTSMTIKGSFNNNYIDPEKLAHTVRELISIDYSVFHRETVVKLGNAREVIEEEVIPNFVLLPCHGTKTMLWQELDGTNRKTRGRIVVPIFFTGDITKSLAHSFACFRWELNRTIKGGMWADPVEGGITGLYFDYVNFYKKSKKLSLEAKEKITEKFRSLRTNRDRFADDYIMWVLYEKDGIMRINSVIRDMFFRNIPFRKEMRVKLENMPAYNEIAPRYKNIQARNITGYERKYKKYFGENGKLPDELQKYMDFLNS
jgi:hypothetical protein